ncbi:hypothetical protein CGRA01v4_14639 [Colletotrichum graminicola]|nr:hypothetical protein CGRA01v4_14639 [Colletotrichum graminicola]
MVTVSFAGSPFARSPTNPCQHLTSKPCISLCPGLPHLPYQQRSTDTNPICSIDSPLVEAAHAGRRRLKSDAITRYQCRLQSSTFRYMAIQQSCISPRGASSRGVLAGSFFAAISMQYCTSVVPICPSTHPLRKKGRKKRKKKKKSPSVSLESINRAITADMTPLCFLINEGTPCIFKFRLQRHNALVWLDSELCIPILSKRACPHDCQ